MNTLQLADMQNYGALFNLFNRYHDFALSTHINPDGDAIGSELGLYLFLTRLGKSVKMFNTDAVPGNYKFLPGWENIEDIYTLRTYQPEVLIVLDAKHPRTHWKNACQILAANTQTR